MGFWNKHRKAEWEIRDLKAKCSQLTAQLAKWDAPLEVGEVLVLGGERLRVKRVGKKEVHLTREVDQC